MRLWLLLPLLVFSVTARALETSDVSVLDDILRICKGDREYASDVVEKQKDSQVSSAKEVSCPGTGCTTYAYSYSPEAWNVIMAGAKKIQALNRVVVSVGFPKEVTDQVLLKSYYDQKRSEQTGGKFKCRPEKSQPDCDAKTKAVFSKYLGKEPQPCKPLDPMTEVRPNTMRREYREMLTWLSEKGYTYDPATKSFLDPASAEAKKSHR